MASNKRTAASSGFATYGDSLFDGDLTLSGDVTFANGSNIKLGTTTTSMSVGQTIDLRNHRLIELAAPVDPTDAVNKSYVDTAIASAIANLTVDQQQVQQDLKTILGTENLATLNQDILNKALIIETDNTLQLFEEDLERYSNEVFNLSRSGLTDSIDYIFTDIARMEPVLRDRSHYHSTSRWSRWWHYVPPVREEQVTGTEQRFSVLTGNIANNYRDALLTVQDYVEEKIRGLRSSSPAQWDTLGELADYINATDSSTTNNLLPQLGTKIDNLVTLDTLNQKADAGTIVNWTNSTTQSFDRSDVDMNVYEATATTFIGDGSGLTGLTDESEILYLQNAIDQLSAEMEEINGLVDEMFGSNFIQFNRGKVFQPVRAVGGGNMGTVKGIPSNKGQWMFPAAQTESKLWHTDTMQLNTTITWSDYDNGSKEKRLKKGWIQLGHVGGKDVLDADVYVEASVLSNWVNDYYVASQADTTYRFQPVTYTITNFPDEHFIFSPTWTSDYGTVQDNVVRFRILQRSPAKGIFPPAVAVSGAEVLEFNELIIPQETPTWIGDFTAQQLRSRMVFPALSDAPGEKKWTDTIETGSLMFDAMTYDLQNSQTVTGTFTPQVWVDEYDHGVHEDRVIRSWDVLTVNSGVGVNDQDKYAYWTEAQTWLPYMSGGSSAGALRFSGFQTVTGNDQEVYMYPKAVSEYIDAKGHTWRVRMNAWPTTEYTVNSGILSNEADEYITQPVGQLYISNYMNDDYITSVTANRLFNNWGHETYVTNIVSDMDPTNDIAPASATLVNAKAPTWYRDGYSNYGLGMAMTNNYLITGNPGADYGNDQAGTVEIHTLSSFGNYTYLGNPYNYSGSRWAQEEQIKARGSYFVVGSPRNRGQATGGGSIHIYHEQGSQQNIIWNPNDYSSKTNDYFGYAVDIGQDIVVASAYGEDAANATSNGIVYVFNWRTGELLQRIRPPVDEPYQQFGKRIVLSKDDSTLFVASPYKDVYGYSDSGRIYAFEPTTGVLKYTINNPNIYGFENVVPLLRSQNITGAAGYTVGAGTSKDMSIGTHTIQAYPYSPLASPTNIDTSVWSDWGSDIFDTWGMWYIYNSVNGAVEGIQFQNRNGADGVIYEETHIKHNKTFLIKHGYTTSGIYKIDISCSDPEFQFQVGMYGNMGSDSSTVLTGGTYNVSWGTLSYAYNYQSGSATERFYTYMIPYEPSTNASNFLTYNRNGNDNLAIYANIPLRRGVTIYHAKQNDVYQWVANDIVSTGSNIANGGFGRYSMDTSSTLLAVSSPYEKSSEGDTQSGVVHLFDLTDGTWVSTVENPNYESTKTSDNFGYSLCLSEKYMIIGAPNEDSDGYSNSGAAYLYSHGDNVPLYTFRPLPNYREANSQFGRTVLVNDNDKVAIAAPLKNINTTDDGLVYLYNIDRAPTNDIGRELVAKYDMNDVNSYANSGNVWYDISGNDYHMNTSSVGFYAGAGHDPQYARFTSTTAYGEVSNAVLANRDELTFSTWFRNVDNHNYQTFISYKINNEEEFMVSREGDWAQDSLFVTWNQTKYEIKLTEGTNLFYNNPAWQLLTVTAKVGDKIVVYVNGVQVGETPVSTNQIQVSTPTHLYNPNPGSDLYGRAIATDGIHTIVGAPNDDTIGTNKGYAYVFNNQTGALVSSLRPADVNASTSDYAASEGAVDICGNYAIIGAYAEDETGSNSGAAYVYDVTTGELIHNLQNPNVTSTTANDWFGYAVSIDKNFAAVGARYEDTNGTDAGVVYIFDVSTGKLLTHIENPSMTGSPNSDTFGNAVSIQDDYLVVGAEYEDGAYSDTGAAYIFTKGADAEGDQYWDNVIALCNGTSEDVATGKTITNGVTYMTDVGRFDRGYILSADTNVNSISISNPDDANHYVLDSDFTIEGWYVSTGINRPLFQVVDSGVFGVYHEGNSGTFNVYLNGDAIPVELGYSPTGWFHVALVRYANIVTLYVDGRGIWSQYTPGTLSYANATVEISGSQVSDFRITKGVARYTGTYYVGNIQSQNDQYWNNVTFFLNAEDSVAMADLTGESPVFNNATTTDTVFKNGNSSLAFDGSQYISYGPSAKYAMGTDDFTIESFVNTSSIDVIAPRPLSNSDGAWSEGNWSLHSHHVNEANVYTFWVHNANPSSPLLTSTSLPSIGEWDHVAVTREGDTWKLFVNGVLEDTNTSTASLDSGVARSLYVGGDNTGNAYFNGYMDDVRITKGIARYIDDFAELVSVNGLELVNSHSVLESAKYTGFTLSEPKLYRHDYQRDDGTGWQGTALEPQIADSTVDLGGSLFEFENFHSPSTSGSVLATAAARNNITLKNAYVRFTGQEGYTFSLFGTSYVFGYGNGVVPHTFENIIIDARNISYDHVVYSNGPIINCTNVKIIYSVGPNVREQYINYGSANGYDMVLDTSSEGQALLSSFPDVKVSGNTPVITEGLRMLLDANDILSHDGTDDLWKDISGNNNNMNRVNTPYVDTYPRHFSFTDNAGHNMYAADSDNARNVGALGDFTIDMWLRLDTMQTYITPFSYNIGATNELTLYKNQANVVELYIKGSASGKFTVPDALWNVGNWVNFTVKREGNSASLYIDGTLVATDSSVSTGIISIGGYLVLGQEQDSNAGGFQTTQDMPGDIGYFAVYEVALTDAQVQQNYASNLAIYNGTTDTYLDSISLIVGEVINSDDGTTISHYSEKESGAIYQNRDFWTWDNRIGGHGELGNPMELVFDAGPDRVWDIPVGQAENYAREITYPYTAKARWYISDDQLSWTLIGENTGDIDVWTNPGADVIVFNAHRPGRYLKVRHELQPLHTNSLSLVYYRDLTVRLADVSLARVLDNKVNIDDGYYPNIEIDVYDATGDDIFNDGSTFELYKFDGNVKGAFGYDGTTSNTTYLDGKFSNGLKITRSFGQEVVLPPEVLNIATGTKQWTYSVWMKIPSHTNFDVVIGHLQRDFTRPGMFVYGGNMGYFASSNGSSWDVAQGATQTGRGSITLPINEWFHVVYTRDEEGLKGYINGVLDWKRDIGPETVLYEEYTGYNGTIGRWGNNSTSYMSNSSEFDQIRFLTKGVSPSDVQALYNELDSKNTVTDSFKTYSTTSSWTNPVLLHSIVNPDVYKNGAGDNFGWKVDTDGVHAIIAAPYEDMINFGDSGAAYVFDCASGELLHTLNNPNTYLTGTSDHFAYDVAIDGNFAAVGARYEDDPYLGGASGKVYVFDIRTGYNVAIIDNPNITSSGGNDYFGWSVDIAADTLVAGAPNEDTGATDSGHAYHFDITEVDAPTALRPGGQVRLGQRQNAQGSNTGADYDFAGDFASVSIYGTALTPQEVSANYDAKKDRF